MKARTQLPAQQEEPGWHRPATSSEHSSGASTSKSTEKADGAGGGNFRPGTLRESTVT